MKRREFPNKEEERKYKAFILLALILVLLVSSFISFVAIYGYSNLPKYQECVSHYTVDMINDDIHLETDGALVLVNDKETLKLSSSSSNVNLGSVSPHDYIYASVNGGNSDVSILFKRSDSVIKNLRYTVVVSDSDGNNRNALSDSDYVIDHDVLTYSSSSNIYIYSVSVSYLLKV